MKFTKRHLVASVVFLVASILYNVSVFWGGASAIRPRAGMSGEVPAESAAASQVSTLDPAEIPPPPAVDLAVPPSWERDPFTRPGGDAPPEPAAAAAAQPSPAEPKVRSILFSPQRRLAIVDGRVVGIGDRLLTGATIVDITRDAVTLRMPSGEERRLALRQPGAPN